MNTIMGLQCLFAFPSMLFCGCWSEHQHLSSCWIELCSSFGACLQYFDHQCCPFFCQALVLHGFLFVLTIKIHDNRSICCFGFAHASVFMHTTFHFVCSGEGFVSSLCPGIFFHIFQFGVRCCCSLCCSKCFFMASMASAAACVRIFVFSRIYSCVVFSVCHGWFVCQALWHVAKRFALR